MLTTPSWNRRKLSHRRPSMVLDELEPSGKGGLVQTTTVFLTGSRCPVGCRMCDLHLGTLPGPTPAGAIPEQIDVAFADRSRRGWLKLYNHGNFFDRKSIPPEDYEAIAARCQGFSRLVVENHPSFGASRLEAFRDLLTVPLEVAVGLETVQPRWLKRLAKQMTRDQFDRYARWLADLGVDLRVFLIVGVPGINVAEALRWTRLSVRHAIAAGARHISLIPARFGSGWSGWGEQLPCLTTSHLAELQRTALADAALADADRRVIVTIDLWGIEPSAAGFEDLQRRNLSQAID